MGLLAQRCGSEYERRSKVGEVHDVGRVPVDCARVGVTLQVSSEFLSSRSEEERVMRVWWEEG